MEPDAHQFETILAPQPAARSHGPHPVRLVGRTETREPLTSETTTSALIHLIILSGPIYWERNHVFDSVPIFDDHL